MAEADFSRRLRAIFDAEAAEHLAVMFSSLTELELSQDENRRAELVETVFREAHSLKGAASAVGLKEIEKGCQALEDRFAAMKRREVAFAPVLFDRIHRDLDAIRDGIEQLAHATPAASIERLQRIVRAGEQGCAQQGGTPLPVADKDATLRVSAQRIDAILLQVEQMLAAKLAAAQRRQELREMSVLAAVHGKAAAAQAAVLATGLSSSQALPEIAGRSVDFGRTMSRRLCALAQAADRDQRMLARMVDDLLADVKQVLMLPFATLTEGFPKLVRDISAACGKRVGLVMRGGEIEADRRLLEGIKDPLVHLLRNSLDHGIEKPEIRSARGKAPQGRVSLEIEALGAQRIGLTLADDGGGIDLQQVKARAQALGLMDAESAARLDDKGALELVYHSGLSTSEGVTEISGRGLGLAIVREKIERLGGEISLENQPGSGVRFRIVLPTTVSTYRGVVVGVGSRQFVLPTARVEQVLRIPLGEISAGTVDLAGEAVPLVRLGELLSVAHEPRPSARFLPAAVLAAGGTRKTFLVDEVLDEHEVLVKCLGPQLKRVKHVEALTVLGSGKIVAILSVNDLLNNGTPCQPAREDGSESVAAPPRRILVAEDSFTARSLLRNMLEMAGYEVVTATDGLDAWLRLQEERFDLVVSDVQMPRMGGFELTEKIRANATLAGLPVVLVTALESEEDRVRGNAAGASAQIAKRNFEQGDLLEAVQRLV